MKSVKLQVNGVARHLIVDEDRVLLDLLRDDLSLTGAKQSCDRKGQCGACTVIVNDKAVLSCLHESPPWTAHRSSLWRGLARLKIRISFRRPLCWPGRCNAGSALRV